MSAALLTVRYRAPGARAWRTVRRGPANAQKLRAELLAIGHDVRVTDETVRERVAAR